MASTQAKEVEPRDSLYKSNHKTYHLDAKLIRSALIREYIMRVHDFRADPRSGQMAPSG